MEPFSGITEATLLSQLLLEEDQENVRAQSRLVQRSSMEKRAISGLSTGSRSQSSDPVLLDRPSDDLDPNRFHDGDIKRQAWQSLRLDPEVVCSRLRCRCCSRLRFFIGSRSRDALDDDLRNGWSHEGAGDEVPRPTGESFDGGGDGCGRPSSQESHVCKRHAPGPILNQFGGVS